MSSSFSYKAVSAAAYVATLGRDVKFLFVIRYSLSRRFDESVSERQSLQS